MKLTGKQTWKFQQVYVQSSGTAVGPREAEGKLAGKFDKSYDNLHCDEDNWELAERKLMGDGINIALDKANLTIGSIDTFIAGDLLNQNITANYVARQLQIPFLCMFGACSTSMETVATASALVEGGFSHYVLASTSSHNATAERQFRYPTEYGGQKPNTATFTVTGSGSVIIGNQKSNIQITSATIGKIQDLGINDPFDMGSAMAPAAADTITQHFKDLGTTPTDYDLIVTGDLSGVGKPICEQMVKEEGYDISSNYHDCGLMLFHDNQEVFAGGSGCGCSAVVTYGHLFKELEKGTYNRILVVATGALMSPTMIQQKETIPTIAHGVVFERVQEEL